MRKNFGPKSWLYPMPVLIIATYNEDKTADAMNAAWGAISQSNHISICVSAGHKTTQNILARKAFTVSMADAAHVVACDYVGVVSGNNSPYLVLGEKVGNAFNDGMTLKSAFDKIYLVSQKFLKKKNIFPLLAAYTNAALYDAALGTEKPQK